MTTEKHIIILSDEQHRDLLELLDFGFNQLEPPENDDEDAVLSRLHEIYRIIKSA